jgi:hypothetical protein
MNKQRLGSDPFEWMNNSKPNNHVNHSTSSKQILQSQQDLQKSTKKGLPGGWERATFIVREDHLEKIRDVAYWDRKQIKEVIAEALEAYLSEKKVKPRRR